MLVEWFINERVNLDEGKNMKKITLVFLMVGFIAGAMCADVQAQPASPKKRIGVLVWADNLRYRQSMEGTRERLKQEGLTEDSVEIREEGALGNKAKAVKIAQELAAQKMDLYIAVGTSASLVLSKEIQNAPMLFSVVYDPVASGLVKSMQNPGQNITGASTFLPMSQLLEIAKRVRPIKDLAILYTPGERNSESQLKDLTKTCAELGIHTVPVPVLNAEEVSVVVGSLAGKVDAVFIAASSVFDKTGDVISEALAKTGILTLSHLLEYVDKGAILGVGGNPHELGIAVGEQAIQILKGAKAGEIPVAIAKKLDIYINLKSARSAGVEISEDLRKEAAKVIE